ncbi:hypothetical protein AB0H76_30650 [Nocardia sp. NPDC050712]|uniref:hypothetical protein n=1 Tax=Nocardia sp. NPDC050712 TaxID=3155518 RepID=UPI0033CCE6C7
MQLSLTRFATFDSDYQAPGGPEENTSAGLPPGERTGLVPKVLVPQCFPADRPSGRAVSGHRNGFGDSAYGKANAPE